MQVITDFSTITHQPLPKGQVYIYILENDPQRNIKIGRTHDIKQRLISLSGSNTGGNHLRRCAISQPTNLYNLEHMAHEHFAKSRIEGTEWFNSWDMTFETAIQYIESLFQADDYAKCNDTRERFNNNTLTAS